MADQTAAATTLASEEGVPLVRRPAARRFTLRGILLQALPLSVSMGNPLRGLHPKKGANQVCRGAARSFPVMGIALSAVGRGLVSPCRNRP